MLTSTSACPWEITCWIQYICYCDQCCRHMEVHVPIHADSIFFISTSKSGIADDSRWTFNILSFSELFRLFSIVTNLHSLISYVCPSTFPLYPHEHLLYFDFESSHYEWMRRKLITVFVCISLIASDSVTMAPGCSQESGISTHEVAAAWHSTVFYSKHF